MMEVCDKENVIETATSQSAMECLDGARGENITDRNYTSGKVTGYMAQSELKTYNENHVNAFVHEKLKDDQTVVNTLAGPYDNNESLDLNEEDEQKLKHDVIDPVNNELEKLRNDISDKDKQLREKCDESERVRKELQESKLIFDVLVKRHEEEFNRFKEELSHLKMQHMHDAETITNLENIRLERDKEMQQIYDENKRYQDQLKLLRSKLQESQAKFEDQMDTLKSNHTAQMNEQKRNNTDECERLKLTMHKEKDFYKDNIARLEEENKMKQKDLETKEKEIKECCETWAEAFKDKAIKICDLETEVENLKAIKEKNKQTITAQHDEMTKLTIQCSNVKDENRKQTLRIENLETTSREEKQDLLNELTTKAKDVQHKDCIIKEQKTAIYEMKTLNDSLKQERENLSQRLSAEWSQKVAGDESNLENISIKNRPMNIASEYSSLCSNEWLDVKGDLDKIDEVSEEDKMTLLCEILLLAEKFAVARHDKIMKHITLGVSQPLMYESLLHSTRTSNVDDKENYTDNHDNNHNENYNNQNVLEKESMDWESVEESKLPSSKCSILSRDLSHGSHVDCDNSSDSTIQAANCSLENSKCAGNCLDERGRLLTYDRNLQCAMHDYQVDNQYFNECLIVNAKNVHNAKTLSDEQLENSPDIQSEITERAENISIELSSFKHKVNVRNVTELQECLSEECLLPSQLPDNMKHLISDFHRLHADNIYTKDLKLDILFHLEERSKTKVWLVTASNYESFHKYLAACACLTWKMIIQRPKMQFCVKGLKCQWDEKSQEPAYGSENPKDSKAAVVYYLCPSLYHADKLMQRGKVMIKIFKDKTV